MVAITSFYAGVLTILFIGLSAQVILYRRKHRIAYGDADTPRFTAMVQAQGNFAEYVPLGLILLGLAELNGAGAILLHMIGLPLLAGRVMHGLGLAFVPRQMRWRVWGMMATATSLAIGACAALLLAL